MNFTSKNSRFGAIRENEPPKKREERNKEQRNDNRFKAGRSKQNRRQTEKPQEPKKVSPPPLTQDYYPTLGQATSNESPQEAPSDSVPKEETTWKDLIAKREEEEEAEKELEPIKPGWIRLRMDKKTHKIITEHGPPVEDSGWFSRWQEHERMIKQRRWLAYMEEQEEIRRELEPDYLYRHEDYAESDYYTDDEDILVEEECLSDEADGDY